MDKKEKGALSKLFTSIGNMFGRLFSFGQRPMMDPDAILSPKEMAVGNFKRNRLAMGGLLLFIVMAMVVMVGSYLNPVNYNDNEPILRNTAPGRSYLSVPSKLKKEGIKKIESGVSFSYGLSETGNLYFWGTATEGVNKLPKEIKQGQVKDIAVGDRHVLAMMDSGEIVGWGLNSFDQAEVPTIISQELLSDRPAKIFANDMYSGVLTQSGHAYVWGSTMNTELHIVPSDIQGRIVDVEATSFNVLYILDDGTVEMNGTMGQPLQTSFPESLKDHSLDIKAVAATQAHGLALDAQGKLHVWGRSNTPQTQIPEALASETVVQINAGKAHFVALTDKGEIFAWGSDLHNQTNIKATQGKKYSNIFSGYYQSYALENEHQVTPFGFKGFLLGSDSLGRDVAVRLLHGGRITMFIGIIAVLISTFLGVTVGLIAGFYGGWIDNVLMRFAEIVNSFPFLPLAVTLSTMLAGKMSQSQRLFMVMVILGVISWPGLARMIRGQILAEREKDFVLAARALGIPTHKIIIKHILPAVFNIVIVTMTLGYAGNLLTESGLSFLGFGVMSPEPSWGNMLSGSQSARVIEFYWWQWLLPAVCVLLAALSVNLVGDGLREALDPKSNEK